VTFLLDTSALLVLYRKESGVERLLELFDVAQHVILLSAVSVAEFERRLADLGQPPEDVERTIDLFLQLFDAVVPLDQAAARASLRLAAELPFRLPMVDSLIAATARIRGACLVHRDKHMTPIPTQALATLYLDGA
jgi:predicted nucleic acid-binding protein